MSSEWMPIETAPVDTNVRVARWTVTSGKWYWFIDIGVPFETHDGDWPWSKRKVIRSFDGKYFTHWSPLPPPPDADK